MSRHALGNASAIAVATLAIAVVHGALPESLASWRSLLQHLFYLPIVYAGLRFGWRAGLGTALLSGLGLLVPVEFAAARLWEVPVFCAAGALAGVIAERERKQSRRLSKANQELQESAGRMERSERLSALGQLSAGLAHEIRNPLASISGAAGILRRGQASPEKSAECLEIIHKECQRLSRLLTSFLDFARPRAPRFLEISLESVFDSVLGLAGHAVNGAAVSFRRASDPGLRLDCDAEQLQQVLLNLLINAIQAMPEGGEVVLASKVEDGKAIIEVRDQGCGVRPEDLPHLYDPFFTTKEHGTGLGLPVAHQIVAQLGGALSARHNPERGMTFSIELPLHHEAAS